MMQASAQSIRRALEEFELRGLFLEELGWEPYTDRRYVEVEGVQHELNAVAHKRGMAVYTHVAQADNGLPDSATRRKVERGLAKHVLEHFIVYANAEKTSQIWQWVKREPGSPAITRELGFDGRPTESLVQRLQGISFTLEEEGRVGLPDVWGRVQASFDVEKVTRRFYDLFKKEHDAFLDFIQGLEETEDRQWYASIMLNRLMFIYFIQRKGFLDGNQNYLRDKLQQMRSEVVAGNFLTFYRRFLLRLFHEGLGEDEKHRASEVDALIGQVPYLNGGLFDLHELEESNPDLDIPDEAFERLFDFFDGYRWHLDERPLREDNEINPDVLGYIFEKYINQKQMGAYYTQEDVTGYITQNAVIPYLFDAAREGCAVAFEPASAMWFLLKENPDRYIYEAMRKGVDVPLPDEIAVGLDNVSRRDGWNRPAGEEYALPTETWREHVARRQRCEGLRSKLASGEVHEINDLVTLNLDIRQFAQDAIENAEEPELVRAFYNALKEVSVLDPTCGSGAFLFAALNVLEPMYEACLERMGRCVAEDATGERYSDFRRALSEMERHVSRRYFILKSIMVNNLYGVDIMEEAVEIARLRLFLKLVAQVDEGREIEPLPDLDFNLRTGNTLVGFATLDEIRDALSSTLDYEDSRVRIEAKASEVDDAFQIFRWMQVEEKIDSEELSEAKADVHRKLEDLNCELDRYLAPEYGVDPTNARSLEAWRDTHRPLHWIVEFYGIISSGGFHVLIGNPPYIELYKVAHQYSVQRYVSSQSGNLYCPMMERSLNLACRTGRYGMIVPLSIVSTDRMAVVRELLKSKSKTIWFSHFSGDANPSKLFQGVKFRLSVVLTQVGQGASVWSSSYLKWFAKEREVLFQKISYENVGETQCYLGLIPKLGSSLASTSLNKMLEAQPLEMSFGSGGRRIYVHRVLTMYVKCFDFVPYFRNEIEGVKKSEDYKPYSLESQAKSDCATATLNSSTFFLYFILLGDGFHCGKTFVHAFPADLEHLSSDVRDKLTVLKRRLMEDMKEHAVRRVAKSKRTGNVEYDEFWPRYSKAILDEIDRTLASVYAFTDEELDFIINYDIKYRMGADQA